MIGYIKGVHVFGQEYALQNINNDSYHWSDIRNIAWNPPKLFDTNTEEYKEVISCAATEMLRYPLCWKRIEFVELKPKHLI